MRDQKQDWEHILDPHQYQQPYPELSVDVDPHSLRGESRWRLNVGERICMAFVLLFLIPVIFVADLCYAVGRLSKLVPIGTKTKR